MSVEEITNIVLKHAKYQQVAICFDSNSNLDFIEQVQNNLKKQAVIFSYNFDNLTNLDEVIHDGIKCVISFLRFNNYIRLKSCVNFNFVLIDVLTDNFISPHLLEEKGTTYFFAKHNQLNNLVDVLYVFANLVENRFNSISTSRNYGKEEHLLTLLFENFNSEILEVESFTKLIKEISFILDFDECKVFNSVEEVAFYYYAIILAYKHLFLQFNQNIYMITDIYKQYQNDYNQINLSHKILFNERLNFLLKTNSLNMIDFIDLFLNKINFNLLKINNNIKIINILKILKNNIKLLNKDNLLKISYLYGIFEAI